MALRKLSRQAGPYNSPRLMLHVIDSAIDLHHFETRAAIAQSLIWLADELQASDVIVLSGNSANILDVMETAVNRQPNTLFTAVDIQDNAFTVPAEIKARLIAHRCPWGSARAFLICPPGHAALRHNIPDLLKGLRMEVTEILDLVHVDTDTPLEFSLPVGGVYMQMVHTGLHYGKLPWTQSRILLWTRSPPIRQFIMLCVAGIEAGAICLLGAHIASTLIALALINSLATSDKYVVALGLKNQGALQYELDRAVSTADFPLSSLYGGTFVIKSLENAPDFVFQRIAGFKAGISRRPIPNKMVGRAHVIVGVLNPFSEKVPSCRHRVLEVFDGMVFAVPALCDHALMTHTSSATTRWVPSYEQQKVNDLTVDIPELGCPKNQWDDNIHSISPELMGDDTMREHLAEVFQRVYRGFTPEHTFRQTLDELSDHCFAAAMKKTHGNKSRAAALLQLPGPRDVTRYVEKQKSRRSP